MRLGYLLPTIALAACVSVPMVPIQAERFVGPNGGTAYSMQCSGMGRTLDACFKKAGEICPRGYTIIDRTTGTAIASVNGNIMSAQRNSLAIECK